MYIDVTGWQRSKGTPPRHEPMEDDDGEMPGETILLGKEQKTNSVSKTQKGGNVIYGVYRISFNDIR